MDTSIITTEAPKGFKATIRFKEEYEPTPPFDRIGANTDNGYIKGFNNLCGVMEDMSSAAGWLFWRLTKLRNQKDNISILKAKNNLEAKKIAKGYKELAEAKIIIRVKRQHYLFNPRVWFPSIGEFNNVCNDWRQINGK